MKKLLVIALCFFSSLSLYSQDKTDPFWALMSFDNSGKVIAYQEFEKPLCDQLVSVNKITENSRINYGYWGDDNYKHTSATEFIGKITDGYCFAGSQAQAYSDLFKNTETISVANKKADADGEYIEDLDPEQHYPNVVTVPLERTYSVSLDSNSALKIVLTNEKECSDFVYIRTEDADDHPRAPSWEVYKCNKWTETSPNTLVKITPCENWKGPLKEYLINLYNLPKEIF